MANRWKRTEHPNPLLKSFRPLLGAPWEPTDQRSRGQINSSSSRSHGWGQRAIADTFLPCCSEPQRGHPEPLDKPAALVIIIVRWFLLCSSWGIFWIDLLCCAIHPPSYGVCCYPDNLGAWLNLYSFQTGEKPETRRFVHLELLLFCESDKIELRWRTCSFDPQKKKKTLLLIKCLQSTK